MHENARIIWDILRSNGCTEAGAAGAIGNMEAESGLESCRMQGDFTEGYRASKQYAARIDSGAMSGAAFAHDTSGGGGWGLCQWTFWDRKLNLFDFLKEMGLSIGDLRGQVLFFIKECKERYPQVWAVLSSAEDIGEASDAVLLKFERPADMYNKRAYRTARSRTYYNALAGSVVETAPEEESAEEEEEENSEPKFCPAPIRILKMGMSGNDVRRWQQLLKAAGFDIGRAGADGIFGSATRNAVVSFQRSMRLDADGVVGADTFNAMWRA